MSDQRPLTTGISSRRSACDRCRAQKSRCLRQNPGQTRCDRCNRADSDCVTSPIYRMRAWQSPGGETAMSSMHSEGSRKRHRPGNHQLWTPTESVGALSPQHNEDTTCTDDSNAFSDRRYSASAHTWTIQADTGPHQVQTDGNAAMYDVMFDEAIGSYGGSDLGLTSDLFATAALPEAQPGPSEPSASSLSRSLSGESPFLVGPSPSSGRNPQIATQRFGDGSASSIDPVQDKDTPLQQLSRVDYTLITLLSHLGKGLPHVDMDTLVSPIDPSKSSTPAVDDILNTTSKFIDVLKLLSGDRPPPPPKKPGPGRLRRRLPAVESLCGRSDDEDSTDSSTDSICSTLPSPASLSNQQSGLTLDTGSLTAILSSYIRVLRLHLVVFAHIYDFLKELAKSDEPVLCPVPGLSFCTFPIQSGNLQTIILIQVVSSLFERMDNLLGLPSEFRISKRKEEPHGLFGQHGFMTIADPIMRKEDDGEPHHGKGGIKSLRKHIKKTKQLLRDSIAP